MRYIVNRKFLHTCIALVVISHSVYARRGYPEGSYTEDLYFIDTQGKKHPAQAAFYIIGSDGKRRYVEGSSAEGYIESDNYFKLPDGRKNYPEGSYVAHGLIDMSQAIIDCDVERSVSIECPEGVYKFVGPSSYTRKVKSIIDALPGMKEDKSKSNSK